MSMNTAKHRDTPSTRPSLFEIPETSIVLAALVAGLMVGALPLPPLALLLLGFVVFTPMGLLILAPAPSTARRVVR